MQKILIIRFSSIGDIVLTSPIIRSVKNQIDSEIHFLTKQEYSDVLDSNPYVDKIIFLKSNILDTVKDLKSEKYNIIIDLHNNLRSCLVKFNLRLTSYNFRKERGKRFLLINFGLNLLNNHVVDRYFNCIKKLNVINDNNGLDYFLNKKTLVEFPVNQPFIAWCIGSSYEQKTLSKFQIIDVCNNLSSQIVLIGGDAELVKANYILKHSTNNNIHNFCGKLSIDESAFLLKNSNLVVTSDTGFMHIAAAFKKTIISCWGCTKPSLGFYPYMTNNQSSNIVINPDSKPCSKHGNFCRFQQDGCIKQINSSIILESILDFIDV